VDPEILVVEDPAAPACERLVRVAARGGHIALAGGSTPRAAYERAAEAGAEWAAATLWFGDERCVPPDDERSNYRLAREALLDRLGAAGPAVRRIEGELGPDAAAAAYEAALFDAFGSEDAPRLDLVVLGLGPDAHCASLFPGKPALVVSDRLVTGVPEPGLEPRVPRVTLTLPAINAAREVVFLATGPAKAEAVARAFGDRPDPAAPAALVRPRSGRMTVLLDPPAARGLASGN
jgi:6-phosphogluconolactonase